MDASYFVFYPDICFFCAMTCYTLATVREKSSLLMVLSVNVLRIRLKNSSKKVINNLVSATPHLEGQAYINSV